MATATWGEVLPDFLLSVRGAGLADGTERYYRMYLQALVAWAEEECVRFADFDRRALRRYCSYRKEARHPLTGRPLAESTRRHDVVCARRLTKFAAAEGWIEVDPLRDFPLPKAERVTIKCPSVEEVQKLLLAILARWDVRRNPKARYMAVADRSFLRLRDYAIILTLLETGMRIGEVFGVEFEDLHLDGPEPYIHVRRTKTREPRDVPVTPPYLEAIANWRTHRESMRREKAGEVKRAAARGLPPPDVTERWFCSTVQTPIDYGAFRRTFLAYLDFAGLERFTRHGIRHLFATIHANRNAVSAMYLLGHKRLQTTQGYVHEQRDRIRRDHAAVDLIGAALSGAPAPPKSRRRKKTV